MRPGERVRGLRGQREQAPQRQRPFRDELAQGPSLHEFHRDVGEGVSPPYLVDRDDVGMVQRGGRARLLLETGEPVAVPRERLGQDFDRHFSSQPRIPCPPHLSHSAGAERREDFLRTEPTAGFQGHLVEIIGRPLSTRALHRLLPWALKELEQARLALAQGPDEQKRKNLQASLSSSKRARQLSAGYPSGWSRGRPFRSAPRDPGSRGSGRTSRPPRRGCCRSPSAPPSRTARAPRSCGTGRPSRSRGRSAGGSRL